MIKVLFFARLREQLRCAELSLDCTGITDVSGVRQALYSIHPEWKEVLASEQILTAVNQVLIKNNCSINDGDEIAFFPPVTGG